MNELEFIPIRGLENVILAQKPQNGWFYVATDTGKMYMGAEDPITGEIIHKSIGGSGASILYGKTAELNELPDGTFLLTNNDLEDPDASVNLDDLIINVDGKFLRVSTLQSDNSFICSLIAVSGTGGGGGSGGGGVSIGSASITSLINQSFNYRYGDKVKVKFNFISTYADGSPSGAATATFHINNGVAVYETEISQGENEIDVTKFLNVGRQKLTIRAQADVGAAAPQIVTYTWTITATELILNWDYDISTINDSNSTFKLNWYVAGDDVDKTTHIIIDNNEALETLVVTTANSKNEEIDLAGLPHGIHLVEMYMDATIGTQKLSTQRIKYQLIFIDEEGVTPVIAYNIEDNIMQQYDTLSINIAVYDPTSTTGTTSIIIRENDIDIATLSPINNAQKVTWNYTPTVYREQKITLVCGTTEVSFTIQVNKIDLGDTEETTGYAFKLKASDISSNSALQSWNTKLTDSIYNSWADEDKNVDITFSDNFDWINGGLQQETLSDGSKRNYICVRAGTAMTINYDLFKMASSTVRNRGKSFKFIFKATNCRDYDAQVLSCYNQGLGLVMNAQGATLVAGGETLSTPYCEDSYIEFEFDIWPQEISEYGRRYIMFWLDGVPTGIKVYTTGSNLEQAISVPIVIGSEDCDVNIYMVKAYEKHLNDEEHLNNFIMDSYNADEMMARFLRNDILESGRISYSKLVERNPGCQAYLYDIPRMTKNKKDKVGTGDGGADDYITFMMYENTSVTPALTAKDVVMKVQGTSSARYGVAAFNFDSDFTDGFTTSAGKHIDGYSMNENSIPIDYFCTKVNVASSEGANNALNQEWYNNFQPWKNRLRRRNSKARDCMEFKPGIVFLRDRNTTKAIDSSGSATSYDARNVFEDTSGYIDNPYYKQYAIGCMGNSKDNIEVLHDISNPYECCVEVADNQEPGQWMTILQGAYITKDAEGNDVTTLVNIDPDASLDDTTLCNDGIERLNRDLWETGMDNIYEFRYPDGISDLADMFKTWTDTDKEKWDLQSLLDENILTEERISVNPYVSAVEGWHRFVVWMVKSNPAGYTGEKLSQLQHFDDFTFKTSEEDFIKGYNNGSLAGLTISTYSGDYEYDTYEYRMAKMLSECEDYLCMESVVFHYLFIERHTMVDNVAKNTFWSTEDGLHWNLTKNYDNDTADGNDNQGRLSLTYGIECLDIRDEITGTRYFNAHQSVWLNFINGLYAARKTVYIACNSKGAWNAANYLSDFANWQSCIPERCWIEDYYRKYRRPRELGLDSEKFYLEMLEGGKKTHQRKQYETYQDSYITSLYNPENYEGTNVITLRSNGTLPSIEGIVDTLDIVLYANGYIRSKVGSTESIPIRAKRGEQHSIQFSSETDMSLNNATFYIPFASNIQSLTNIGSASPTQLSFSSAKKLREIDVHHDKDNPNTILKSIGFSGTPLLEKITAQGCPNTITALDLSSLKNLKEIYVDGSGFTTATFADGGLLEIAHLNNITGLTMRNLINIIDFSIEDYKQLRSIEVINSNIDTYNIIKQIKDSIEVDGASETTILSYNIQDAIWNISEADGNIDIENGTIHILEYLKDSNKAKPIGEISKALALTKKMNFGEDIELNENYKAIDYYNKYINSNEFAGFDIEFQSSIAPLVSITDVSGTIQWARRIDLGGTITNDFLTNPNAPDGIFTKPKDYYDAQYNYVFQNKWNVYTEDGVLLTITPIEGELPIGYTVYQSIIIKPVVSQELRKFSVSFYNHNGELISGYPRDIEYGTMANEIMPNISPSWQDNEPEEVFLTYRFNGYAINNGRNQVVDLSNIKITGAMEFIAVFEKVSVYDSPTDQKRFVASIVDDTNKTCTVKVRAIMELVKWVDKTEFQGKDWYGYYLNTSIPSETNLGYTSWYVNYPDWDDTKNFKPIKVDDKIGIYQQVTPLKGKVTVPNKITIGGLDYLVVGLSASAFQQGSPATTNQITHIFFEPTDGNQDNENTDIKSFGIYVFNFCSALKYIDLPPNISSIEDEYGWGGTSTALKVIISPRMTQIPNMMFQGFLGTLITREDAENEDDIIDPISLPYLTYLGENAFLNATGMPKVSFILPDRITFGGVIGTTCKLITIEKNQDNLDPSFKFLENVSIGANNIIWGADKIEVYGIEEESEVGQFITNHFSGEKSFSV